MNKKRVFGLVLIILSIISSFSNLTLTGKVIGISAGSYLSLVSILSFILGAVLVLASKKTEKWGDLEKILLGKTNSSTLPVFRDVEDGIKKTDEVSPFLAYTTPGDLIYCIYVRTKEDAANIASYLARGRRIYVDKKAEQVIGKKAKSLELEKVKGIIEFKDMIEEELSRRTGKHVRFRPRPQKCGFGSGEYETSRGRAMEMEVIYHKPHHAIGINYPHYQVTYAPKDKKYKREIHILIKKD